MTERFWSVLQDRIARLTDTFRQLKDRVRDAVATEMGRVVSDAVRDLIQTILQPRPLPLSAPPPGQFSDDPDKYEDDRWEDEPDDEEYHRTEPVMATVPEPDRPPVSQWAAAVSVGVVVAKWLIRRRLPLWPTVGIGVGVGTVALVSKPILMSTLTAASAAIELVRIAQSTN